MARFRHRHPRQGDRLRRPSPSRQPVAYHHPLLLRRLLPAHPVQSRERHLDGVAVPPSRPRRGYGSGLSSGGGNHCFRAAETTRPPTDCSLHNHQSRCSRAPRHGRQRAAPDRVRRLPERPPGRRRLHVSTRTVSHTQRFRHRTVEDGATALPPARAARTTSPPRDGPRRFPRPGPHRRPAGPTGA